MDGRGQLFDEAILNIALDEDPLAGRAALASAKEAADDHAFDGAVEVGVFEDHDRAVAAQLQHDMLAGRSPRHRASGFG